MTISEQIYALLSGYSSLSAIVGTKIYPVRAQQGVVKPWVAFFDVSGAPQNSLAGWSGIDNHLYQVDCWSVSHLQAVTMAGYVRAAMAQSNSTFKCICSREFDGLIEPGVEAFHRIVEFSIWTL